MSAASCPVAGWAARSPDAEALVFGNQRWSYAALDHHVARMAARLCDLGVGEGDRVCVRGGNHPDFVSLLHAVARLGAALVPINDRLTESEREPLVKRARAKVTLSLPLETPLSSNAAGPVAETVSPDRPHAILFTSGTTGRPKAAVLTVANLRAAAEGSAVHLGTRPEDRWLGTLPLFHIGGLAMAVRCAVSGCALVLHERFEPAHAGQAFDEERITHASFVPTTLSRMLDARGERPFASSVRAVLIGGGPVPAELLGRARRLGLPVLQTYGLTEACSQVTTEAPAEADATSAGAVLPHLTLRIVDDAGAPLAVGASGEIEVRGPSITAGYFDDPEASAEAFRDGWFRTRDLGLLDARGRLTVLSRRTDLILRGGENVYPAELERVLVQHPAIIEAAVAAEAHATWGQVPIAAIVTRAQVDLAELNAWCRERLARFKVPERFVLVDLLPRNALGKIDRARLRALLSLRSHP